MTTRATPPLTPDEKNRVLASVYRDLFLWGPLPEGELRTREGTALMELHLDGLVDIVRHTTAATIEPYLAQILEDVCAKCAHQAVSGFCPQRTAGSCVVYRYAAPIIRAVSRALLEMGDEEHLRRRSTPPAPRAHDAS